MQRATWITLNSPLFDSEVEEALAFWRFRCNRFDLANPKVRLCVGIVPLGPASILFTDQTITGLQDAGITALGGGGNFGFVHGGIGWYTSDFSMSQGRRVMASDQGWLEYITTEFQSREGWFFLNWVEKPVQSLVKLAQATLGSTGYSGRVALCLTLLGADKIVLKNAQSFGEYRFRDAGPLEVAAIAEDCTPGTLQQTETQLVRRFSRAYGWPAYDA